MKNIQYIKDNNKKLYIVNDHYEVELNGMEKDSTDTPWTLTNALLELDVAEEDFAEPVGSVDTVTLCDDEGNEYLWLVENYPDEILGADENGDDKEYDDFDEHIVFVCEK